MGCTEGQMGTEDTFRCVAQDPFERMSVMYSLTSGRSGWHCVHVIMHRFVRTVPKIKLISLNTGRVARTSNVGILPFTE